MEQRRKIHGNKPRGKLDLNLENVTRNVITLEIAERELMYGRDICKNPEEYTWNKSTTTINCILYYYICNCILYILGLRYFHGPINIY